MSREQAAEAAIPFSYDPATPRHLIVEDIARRRAWPTNPAGYLAQLQAAILGWDSFSRLPQITAPTLVIHGKADPLVPPGNGKLN
jgi:3-oxoadipate enol-lactonase